MLTLTFVAVEFDEYSSQCIVSDTSMPVSNLDKLVFRASVLSVLPLCIVPESPISSSPKDRFKDNFFALNFTPTEDKLMLSLLFLK